MKLPGLAWLEMAASREPVAGAHPACLPRTPCPPAGNYLWPQL